MNSPEGYHDGRVRVSLPKSMTMSLKRSRLTLLIFSFSIFCSAILVILAYNMYPVPDGDAIGPVPAIKAFATTGILKNNLFLIPSTIDPSGQGRYLAYPPGVPWFFGALLSLFRQTSYQSTLIVLALARCSSVIIFTRVIIEAVREQKCRIDLGKLLLTLVLIASNAFFLFASNGRSEILSILIATISLWAACIIKPITLRHLVLQMSVALLFPVSIANGLIGASIYFVYLFFDIRRTRTRFLLFATTSLASIAVFVSSYMLVNVSVQDGLAGILLHANNAVVGYTMKISILQSFGYYRSWIVFGIIALVQLGINLSKAWRNKLESWMDRLLLIATCSVLIILSYFFGGRFASQHYNLYAFLPIYQFMAYKLAMEPSTNSPNYQRLIWRPLLLVAASLSLLQPVQAIVLFPYYLASGSTYSEMLNKFDKVDAKNCHIVYTVGIAMLDDKQRGSQYQLDSLSRIMPTERMKIDKHKDSCVVAFVQEVNSNSKPPQGMKLIADFADKSVYTRMLRSLKILNSPKGYSFKAYAGEIGIDNQ